MDLTWTDSYFRVISDLCSLALTSFILVQGIIRYSRSFHPFIKKVWMTVIFLFFLNAIDGIIGITKSILLDFDVLGAQYIIFVLTRIGHIVAVINYPLYYIFLESTLVAGFRWNLRHYLFIAPLLFLLPFDLYLLSNGPILSPFCQAIKSNFFWYPCVLDVIAVFIFYRASRHERGLPRILNSRFKKVFRFLICIPVMSITAHLFDVSLLYTLSNITRFVIGFSIDYALYKYLSIPFFNATRYIDISYRSRSLRELRPVFEELKQATTLQDFQRITKTFFSEAFGVEPADVTLYIRPLGDEQAFGVERPDLMPMVPGVECLLSRPVDEQKLLVRCLEGGEVMTRDEVEMEVFFTIEHCGTSDVKIDARHVLALLEMTDAHAFIPVQEHGKVIGYIVIEGRHRLDEPNQKPIKTSFSEAEQHEMAVYADYLSQSIELIHRQNMLGFVYENKELKDELFKKQQSIEQYQESFRSLLKTQTGQMVGIIHYKYNKLFCVNTQAKEALGIKGTSLVTNSYEEPLKRLACEFKKYGGEPSVLLTDISGNPLKFIATNDTKKHTVILLAFYPSVAETFVVPFEKLRDLSRWDYALCLETTTAGQLIQRLLPGTTETILRIKIDLLERSLASKPLFITVPEKDLESIVYVVHQISARATIQTIDLSHPEQDRAIGRQLFGVSPLFDPVAPPGLCDILSTTGMIFIKNIEFLAKETQEQLAEYFETTLYAPVGSERKVSSQVRFVCSASNNLEALVQKGLFSERLFHQLMQHTFVLPAPTFLPYSDLFAGTQELYQQLLHSVGKNNRAFVLVPKDIERVIEQKPASLHELKELLLYAMRNKSARRDTETAPITFMPALVTGNPEVAEALAQGKKALKNKQLLRTLLSTYKTQAKVAEMLNVNRSSVSRRCKEFNLIEWN